MWKRPNSLLCFSGTLLSNSKGWLALLIVGFVFSADATITLSPWNPIFQGIDLATGDADASEPTLQHVITMRVDLSNTNISFFSTPSNGTNSLDTFGQTTGTFMSTYHVQAAINANFFSPCCDTTPNEPKTLLGLAMSQGNTVAPQVSSGTGSAVLLIAKNNLATMLITSNTISTANVYTAVAGSQMLLVNGANVAPVDTLNPRTAVGLSQGNRYLYMMVIDGRETDHSAGATLFDTGTWLSRFGAYNGLNLDGGGSTAMLQSISNTPTVLNEPSDGQQRVVGNNFGVFALAIVPPRLTLVGLTTNRFVYFSFNTVPGISYLIDASTNLSNWVTLANVTNGTAQYTYTDSSSTNLAKRFYRVRWAQ